MGFDAAEFDAAEFDAAEFDANRRYRLHERVALRPEPFGALAYHYDNRRLNFLRAPELVTLVESLGEHRSVREAFDSAGLDQSRWPSFEKALASLAASDFLVAI
ncbi:MAG: mycofactocin biosynthesis chaperone MftB [Acidimicrobiaceae bacterium]|nr:mycofactocin biosynthesis chaperone MftB [Acidimicrobiia bacterium]MCY4492966.1 mycofactocin biosynthesis chaperone MftB [Acidimicrobiaceae bacterium]